MPKLPERLGPLTLIHQVGVGKHCQIWEAKDAQGHSVAVKVIVPAMAADPGQRQYLEHELKVAKSLDHPTIIRIDRLSEEGGLPHLVMEYFPHPNLKQQVQAGVEQLADHKAGAAHALELIDVGAAVRVDMAQQRHHIRKR